MLKHKIELPALCRLTREDYEYEVSVGYIGCIQSVGAGWGIKGAERKAYIFCVMADILKQPSKAFLISLFL